MQIETIEDHANAERAAPTHEVRKFIRTAAAFTAGLVAVLLGIDRIVGAHLRAAHRSGGLGPDVQHVVEVVSHRNTTVRTVIVGDSVAHQLFRPGEEPSRQIKFLASNQAIAMAGQCYVAEDAISNFPKLRDIYFFYLPQSWTNDMYRDLTHDYFCGHFHRISQVVEVFRMKRDIELTFAHAGRWMLPNIMAANSLSRPAFALQPTVQISYSASSPPPDPERLLTELSRWIGPPPPAIPAAPPGQSSVWLSNTSRYFLNKLRADCRAHGVRLHVMPCPVSNEDGRPRFADVEHIFDAPIIQDLPAAELRDSIHLKSAFIAPTRQRLIEAYHLDFLGNK